jgi:4-phosphopantoate---beta-alanine ligase
VHIEVPPNHPRAESLRLREKIIHYRDQQVVADAGLIAHGRGEAFDYLLGEATIPPARKATTVAAAQLLLAKKPVISVNGNAAALASDGLVDLAKATGAELEVNLFYRTRERMEAVASLLREAGAQKVLGLDDAQSRTIPELSSERRIVDALGIFVSDVVFVPLEDGDRTEALRNLGKIVIAIDLNPLSRTSRYASITIVDNIIRAIPNMISDVRQLKSQPKEKLSQSVLAFDNKSVLSESLAFIERRLSDLGSKALAN